METNTDAIAAIATAHGPAGVGVIRVSGPNLRAMAAGLTRQSKPILPRRATYTQFFDSAAHLLDEGLLIYFPAPHSFTGEDVVELQGHGGSQVLRLLLNACLEQGARLAQPGEFTQRAFLNGKLDLAQAEAVSDLISAESELAALGAMRSLSGVFSTQVRTLKDSLVELRMQVEGAIDFSDEPIDWMDSGKAEQRIAALQHNLERILDRAQQGSLLRSGSHVVLIGAPNVGKSSLLNALTEEDHALVTDIPGTTRDVIRSQLFIQGVCFHLIDTAGIRHTADVVEQAGIARTWKEINRADMALVLVDVSRGITDEDARLLQELPKHLPAHLVANKSDLGTRAHHLPDSAILVSARTGEGLPELKSFLLQQVGWKPASEPVFLARERHLIALREAQIALNAARLNSSTLELMAEELRRAQQAMGKILGEFTSDQLLGEIFSSFCIGK